MSDEVLYRLRVITDGVPQTLYYEESNDLNHLKELFKMEIDEDAKLIRYYRKVKENSPNVSFITSILEIAVMGKEWSVIQSKVDAI